MDFNQIAITIHKLRQELSACLSLVGKASCRISVSENGDRKGTNL